MTGGGRGGTAVVVGGSIGGSFAARVLADHFERVVVFDKDELPDGARPRKGAPQGVHFHALLARGRQIAQELFPGFDDDLVAAGASQFTVSDGLVYEPWGWAPPVKRDLLQIGASRLLVESVVRRRVRDIPEVEVRTGCAVDEVLATADGATVTGVRVRPTVGGTYDEYAELVLDASGRTSHIEAWLATLGYGAADTTRVNAHWGYASRYLKIPDGVAPPAIGGFPIGPASDGPPSTRGGFLLQQEDGRWLVTLMGCAKDFPPGEKAAYLSFADSLAFPHIGEALREATPLSDIEVWRNTTNRLRRFDRLPRWPDGLVSMADAVCSFNPIYGQGMSIAALEAVDLRTELEHQRATQGDLTGLAARFQRRIADTISQAWHAACRSDYAVPGVEGGGPPAGYAERLAYIRRLTVMSREDDALYGRVRTTQQLLENEDWFDDAELRAAVLARWVELGAVVGLHDPVPTA